MLRLKASRRAVLRLLAASALGRAADLLEIDRVVGDGPRAISASSLRRYRVKATITLLGVPLFTKDNVGGACAMIEQSPAGVSAIQFVSGSWPERLKGFNRFGMVQEAVREASGAAVETAYFSFMTSSAEKSLDQAKKSYSERSGQQPVSVAHGRALPTSYASALDHLTFPATYTWLDCPRLMTEMKARLSPVKELPGGDSGAAYLPFLHAVRAAFAANAASSERTFVHNAKLYRLKTKVSPVPEGLHMVAKIVEPGTNQESEFRVWYDPADGSGLPLRFEFRPKSFLHLSFERDPQVSGPGFRSLIKQEQV
jgi:hypothetical protein